MEKEWAVDEEGVTCLFCGKDVYCCRCPDARCENQRLHAPQPYYREMVLLYTMGLSLN